MGPNAKKINRAIKIGGNVTLRAENGDKATYGLVASIRHHSVQTMNTGHYTTTVRWNGNCWLFNDDAIPQLTREENLERGEIFVYARVDQGKK